MTPRKPVGPQTRERAARKDAEIGSIQKNIESVYDLPKGSVRIVDPGNGRNIRDDAQVKSVRKKTR